MTIIEKAMMRLTAIDGTEFWYDPAGDVFGNGPILYLLQIDHLTLIAWSNDITKTVIVNPITRFKLEDLLELGNAEKWAILYIPPKRTTCIGFVEIDELAIINAYKHMKMLAH